MLGKPWSMNFKNGANANLGVDGSVTPVAFTVDAVADAERDVHKVHLTAELGAALALANNFLISAIATLTNGLLLEGKVGNQAFTWTTCKRTRDLLALGPWQVQTVGTNAILRVELYLPPGARICRIGTYTPDDFLKITVRDNLAALTRFEAFAQGAEV